jgi:thiosulfate/3-mercaptopyruvate sulfurtransferase
VLLLALAAFQLAAPSAAPGAEAKGYPNAHLLMEAPTLRTRLGESGLRLVDVRAPGAYAAGHLPGAVHLPAEDLRSTPVSVLEDRLGRAGIAPDHVVVIYDDQDGLAASRLFLTLEFLGHDRVHLLNGGFRAWVAAGGAVTRRITRHPAAAYRARPRRELIATKADVAAGLGRPDRALVDARSLPEFSGRDVRAARGGHIPGARHVEWTDHLRQEPLPLWKPARELDALFAAAGLTPEKEIVTYCQTHSRASHTYFTLRLMGYQRVKAYLGSWEEWGNDPALPVE